MNPNRFGSGRPQQPRAARTRLRILEAAATAFAEHGYEGVSLNELIRQSGLTKGAFYSCARGLGCASVHE